MVVTGSFLRGTPETATIPVEAYTLEEMRNQGSPSSLDFVNLNLAVDAGNAVSHGLPYDAAIEAITATEPDTSQTASFSVANTAAVPTDNW